MGLVGGTSCAASLSRNSYLGQSFWRLSWISTHLRVFPVILANYSNQGINLELPGWWHAVSYRLILLMCADAFELQAPCWEGPCSSHTWLVNRQTHRCERDLEVTPKLFGSCRRNVGLWSSHDAMQEPLNVHFRVRTAGYCFFLVKSRGDK